MEKHCEECMYRSYSFFDTPCCDCIQAKEKPCYIPITKMKTITNKQWLATLDDDDCYDMMNWLMYQYGLKFNSARDAVIKWLRTNRKIKWEDEE